MLTLLFPSLMIDFGWQRLSAEAGVRICAANGSAPMLPASQDGSGHRVIWVLFDEFDQRLAFDLKQPAGTLPELERLRAESFVANRVRTDGGVDDTGGAGAAVRATYSRAQLIDSHTIRVFDGGFKARGATGTTNPTCSRRRARWASTAAVGGMAPSLLPGDRRHTGAMRRGAERASHGRLAPRNQRRG